MLMLSVEGWINGSLSMIIVFFSTIVGCGFFYDSIKSKIKLLSYAALMIVFAWLFLLGNCIDFITIIFTGTNMNLPEEFLVILNFTGVAFSGFCSYIYCTAIIIPENIKSEWEKIAISGAEKRREWANTLSKSKSQDAFNQAMSGNLPIELEENISEFRKAHFQSATKVATRKASQMVLEVINGTTNLTVGGSADLTGSNLTKTSQTEAIVRGDFQGRYIHYGIREHAMAAIMNGISVHGGFIPYGGTFMVFSDYARGAMRLSALMKQRVIYVLTHDSIGLGEDGPTHQPVEHLTMLRATPNMNVFRPCDIIETAECWEIALNDKDRPSVLALSRQGLPMLRLEHDAENLSARGAYILRETPGQCDVTLIATGSEVEIAIEAADKLSDENNIQARIVSMPCWEKFERQDRNYQQETLGHAPRVAIKAAGRMGWDRWIGSDGAFVGMEDFGASAPAADLYQHFGITAANVAETVLELIKKK